MSPLIPMVVEQTARGERAFDIPRRLPDGLDAAPGTRAPRGRSRSEPARGSCSVAPVPRVPLPRELIAFLSEPNPAVIATLRADGSPHTAPTWYDVDDDLILLNMEDSRLRLRHMRRDPRVALSVLGKDSWYEHVSLLGRIVRIEDDRDLTGIDRLSRRYEGRPFRTRDRLRVNAWMLPARWHGWHD